MLSAISETSSATIEGAEGAGMIASQAEQIIAKSGGIVAEMEEIKPARRNCYILYPDSKCNCPERTMLEKMSSEEYGTRSKLIC